MADKAAAKAAKEAAKLEKKKQADAKAAEKKRQAAEKKATKAAEKERKAAEKTARKSTVGSGAPPANQATAPAPDRGVSSHAAVERSVPQEEQQARRVSLPATVPDEKPIAAPEPAPPTPVEAPKAPEPEPVPEPVNPPTPDQVVPPLTTQPAAPRVIEPELSPPTPTLAEPAPVAADSGVPAGVIVSANSEPDHPTGVLVSANSEPDHPTSVIVAANSEPDTPMPIPQGIPTPQGSSKGKRSTPPARKGGGISRGGRGGSARRSIRGAPQAQVEGVTVVQGVAAARRVSQMNGPDVTEDMLGQEVVEDQCDETVGAMNSGDAERAAHYLANTVGLLKQRMMQLFDNGTNRGYAYAYQAMAMLGRDQPCLASMHEQNKLKNRYGNIQAYDHSRVKLIPHPNDPYSDYINANWISGYKKEKAFIASQGPVPNSFISFWRMIWQSEAEIIVMVTNEIEKNRMKCHRYWPDPTSSPPVKKNQYGAVFVTHLNTVPHKHFMVRTFEVEFEGEKRNLKQFAYTSWPDHGVPLTTQELLGFRNAIRSSVTKPEVPQVIHCSAGVGRTGTYIALDRLVSQALDMGDELSVDRIVHDMRMCRNFMVQTEIQYMFIYRAVLDALSELLSGESEKASAIEMARAAEDKARAELEVSMAAAAAEEAERVKRQEEEEAANREAEKLLEAEDDSMGTIRKGKGKLGLTIKERLQLLQSAEERWLESYRQSMVDWNLRNQFEAETYDTASALTPIQSRIEALRQKGMMDVL